MKRRVFSGLICLLLIAALLLPGCAPQADPAEDWAKGHFDFTRPSENVGGTASVTDKGAVFNSAVRNPSLTLSGFVADITGKGVVRLVYSNTTALESLDFSFLTEADTNAGIGKKAAIPLTKTDGFAEVTVDLSDLYGFVFSLTEITLSTAPIAEGELIVQSLTVEEGGEKAPAGLSFAKPESYLDFKQRNAKGISHFPDGIVGYWKNDDGNINYIGSLMGKLVVTSGSAADPFETVVSKDKLIGNVDRVMYPYASIGQVIRVPDSNLLIGATHLEYQFGNNIFNGVLGLSVSEDDGQTWNLLGEIITHTISPTENLGWSRDIGNGVLYMDDEYLYVYAIDFATDHSGLSVSRCKLEDLYAAVKKGQVPEFKKKHNGEWNQPGIGGEFTSVLPAGRPANFCQVVYNTTLEKYMLFMTSEMYSKNSADIALYLSDDPTDFTQAEPYYVAPSMYGQQYPSVIDETSGNQFEVGENFYLYYCQLGFDQQTVMSDWMLFWGSCVYTRQKITVKWERGLA